MYIYIYIYVFQELLREATLAPGAQALRRDAQGLQGPET